jgi:DNA-binding beta-propeller fold protein YncE
MRKWLLLSASALVFGPVCAWARVSPSSTRNVAAPIRIDADNRAAMTHMLPTGRVLSPVGLINGTPNFATEIIPWGGRLAVLANGATAAQTITVYARRSLVRLEQVRAYKYALRSKPTAAGHLALGHQNFYQGLAAGAHGTLYAAGGATNDVLALQRRGGALRVMRRYALTWQPFPKDQYPYQYAGHWDVPGQRLFYPDAVLVGRGDRHLYVTGMLSNALARINLRTGHTRYLNVGPYPFAIAAADGGKRLVVSLWGGNAVAVIDPHPLRLVGDIRVGPPTGPQNTQAGVHPTALAPLAHSPDVFVALANVDRIAEVNVASLQRVRLLDDSPYPGAPPGSYPDGLTVAGGRLYVANAGNNDVAVFATGSGRPLGLIPTAWYPTALTHTAYALEIVAAKGLGSGPNVNHQWVGDMMDGAIERVSFTAIARNLPQWTRATLRQDGFSVRQREERHAADRRTARFLRKHIRYVVFILRENKTFDEDFGDYRAAGAWADPHLDLYGPKELPNLYALAHRYTLFANFMADGEVTAQGHQWTTAASDSDFVQRTWPEYYSGRGLVSNPGWTQSLIPGGASGAGGVPLGTDNPFAIYQNLSALGKWSNPWISYPQRLFLFNDLLAHHVNFEDFGEFVSRSEAGNISAAMQQHLATGFPGWDRMILDTYREKMAVAWLRKHPGKAFPHFIYIWLPDDHTAGRSPCYYTPDYYVANNDYATAKFIHYLSTTPQWKHMVVFLTEDDAQSGADHINAHRTFALAMGPWVKRGHLSTTLYSQVNILKTTEAILGLPPMSQWDQNASVLAGIWSRQPDFAPTPRPDPIEIPVAFNAGKCSKYTLMRREVGVSGGFLKADWRHWYDQHQDPHGRNLPPPDPEQAYTPTTLLKVPGPQQMQQEWIASKGQASYVRVMAYLQRMARKHHAPLAAYQAGEVE